MQNPRPRRSRRTTKPTAAPRPDAGAADGRAEGRGTWLTFCEAVALGNLGQAWLDLGETTRGQRAIEGALKLHRAAGDRSSEAHVLTNLSPRATDFLAAAHTNLQARAATILDAALRQTFLSRIPVHRDIVAAWAAQLAPTDTPR